ncbi:hypothetical protein [Siminovitchia sp. 179-K 8D1 HS]|uniref:hypothetical protein n=1 Tax=Siminovitchia sp. 179-K 8D1 HS TaxID=3142385 RepID=UPI0039A271D5
MLKFKIKADQIKRFSDFLLSLELRGTQNRMRVRMIKQLDEKLNKIQSEYTEHVLKEHCHLDSEGNPKIKEVNGQQLWDVKKENREDFNKDYLELWNEEHVIEGEDNKNMLLSVKESVLNCDKLFSGQEALQYDHWCDLVEAIEDQKEKE